MDGKGTISDYRNKMDTTLASPDLKNHEKLQTLVRNQILQYSDLQLEGGIENVIERRSNELSNFLGMLRSTADSDRLSSSWKVKHDTEEFRVMYREGPEGTPLHTLLVEGYVDGPLDVCMCISWESGLYSKWWPQTAIPSFKVISSHCLQRVGPGEQISLVRMKVSWPLSSREAVIHYFAFEYFQDDLMVVLLNSISDSETIDRHSHGFTRDGIPNAEELVRIDVVGGFALQKVTAERSYFRTIANMDIKLDFVPPSFLNFVSRQLVGSGFKLYKKEVASVSKGDQKFSEALKDPLYARIRIALDPDNSAAAEDEKRSTYGMQSREEDDNAVDSEAKKYELEKSKEGEMLDDCSLKSAYCTSDGEEEGCRDEATETRREVRISGEVEKALLTLENVIAIFKQQRNETNLENDQISRSSTSVEPTIPLENHASRLRRETSESKVERSDSKRSFMQLQPSMNHNLENVTKNKKHRFCCFALHLPLLR
ncbi:uncharacterized protein LOC121763375 [Salvia splendens]|uniref:uncharacterized protein LOC121763375 n=1 Tax=Salvia splendens TaxID=180675 RepID=UPI001C25CE4C|nr:uncharacterized protein LOC121763375 [Salvia splendens]XP_042015318.1 uncharacterized protein LOC121763375 [Salvia splendens]XP_042015319.1 uncharacterized protein LOC121763375 [Salvia splendens]